MQLQSISDCIKIFLFSCFMFFSVKLKQKKLEQISDGGLVGAGKDEIVSECLIQLTVDWKEIGEVMEELRVIVYGIIVEFSRYLLGVDDLWCPDCRKRRILIDQVKIGIFLHFWWGSLCGNLFEKLYLIILSPWGYKVTKVPF